MPSSSTAIEAANKSAGATDNKAQPRVILFLKDKGGTGASFIARYVAEGHRQRNSGALIVDADGTVGSLFQHLAKRERDGSPSLHQERDGVITFSLHGSETDRDQIATLLDTGSTPIVMDLPATSLTMLKKIESDIGWLGMVRERGYRLTVVAPITPYKATLYDLQDAIALVGDNADYVAVLNLGLAEDRSDFLLWDASEARAALRAVKGIEIEFPRLKPRIAAILDQSDLTFAGGLAAASLSTADKARLAKWLKDAETSVRSASSVLGL